MYIFGRYGARSRRFDDMNGQENGMKEFYRFVMAALSCATNPRIPV
jgi:hypothetical protein